MRQSTVAKQQKKEKATEVKNESPQGGLTDLVNILKESKAIEKANKKFNEMTAAEKRILIAEDVIAQVRANKWQVESGTYMSGYMSTSNKVCDLIQSGQAVKCQACAIGSLFMSGAALQPSKNILATHDDNEMIRVLSNIFSERQLRLMEAAFERGDIGASEFYTEQVVFNAEQFGSHIEDDQDRLVEIMKNVIANKGTFKPPFVDMDEEEEEDEDC